MLLYNQLNKLDYINLMILNCKSIIFILQRVIFLMKLEEHLIQKMGQKYDVVASVEVIEHVNNT